VTPATTGRGSLPGHHHVTAFDADALRAYSRRGNFHSDPAQAAKLGLDGLVAQGMQVAGPAYGMALEEWGEELLAVGNMDLRFVGMVHADETIETTMSIEDEQADVTVTNTTTDATAVVGTFSRRPSV